jgi:ATP-dependent DNA helicase HFM1/MER3
VPDEKNASKPKGRLQSAAEKIVVMVNDALADAPSDTLDFSMKQELEEVLRVGQRISGAMARCPHHPPECCNGV